MHLFVQTVHVVAAIMPHLPLASVMDNNPPSVNGGTGSANIQPIVDTITNIVHAVVAIATALAVLMIVVAGVYIILDRDMSTTKRNERLAFLRSILIGYGIILAASFLITLLQNFLSGIPGQ